MKITLITQSPLLIVAWIKKKKKIKSSNVLYFILFYIPKFNNAKTKENKGRKAEKKNDSSKDVSTNVPKALKK